MLPKPSDFPKTFQFGTATAASQVEGSVEDDGRGRTIWDEIREQKGRVADDSDPNLSCEAYRKYKEDVQLLKELGVTSYRFSICWSRVLPNGSLSVINNKGVQFYLDLCELLVENGIQPVVTLFHADMPLAIFDNGSWLNPQNCQHFIDFADLCFSKFGHLVKTWITFNELNSHARRAFAKVEGELWYCPERPQPDNADELLYKGAACILLTHAKIYRLYQQKYKETQKGLIGITQGGKYCYAATESAEDVQAKDRALDWLLNFSIEPIFGTNSDFPASMRSRLPFLPKFSEEEVELIRGSADFLGLNYYLTHLIGFEKDEKTGKSSSERHGDFKILDKQWDKSRRICGDAWLVSVPEGLYDLLMYVKEKYNNIPVLITENGCMDVVGGSENDVLNDQHRIRYVSEHLNSVAKALHSNCNILGYTMWSLMDNFEWDDGFALRFGICRVDYTDKDKKRTIKASGRFYQDFISQFKKHHNLS